MEIYGRSSARNESESGIPSEWGPTVAGTGLEESMMQMGMWSRELYPERPGVTDCAFYMRTGICGYGNKCRYNHPRDRSSSAGGAVRIVGGEYPERVGEQACQYYLRTGTCKFGASCKFHHPRNSGGSVISVQVNSYGYPLRQGEKECSYYLKTGQCKFGTTCKFHHPQPGSISMQASAHPFYPTVQSPSVPSADQYVAAPPSSYRVTRPPLLPGSYVPGAYGAPVLLSPGVVPIQGWSPYSGTVSPALSPGAQPPVRAGSIYGVAQLSFSTPAFTGPYPPLPSSTGPSSIRSKEHVFPERPDQPECQYYLKTGDCKFGSSCKFHHPPDWASSRPTCVLSPSGHPLRPGEPPCNFYLQRGYCRFGRTCKFDHPMGAVRYSPSASSLTDIPVAPFMIGSPIATLAPSISYPELRPEFISVSKFDPNSNRFLSSGNTLSSSVGLMFPQTGSVPFPEVQMSSQSSPTLTIVRSSRQGEARRSS